MQYLKRINVFRVCMVTSVVLVSLLGAFIVLQKADAATKKTPTSAVIDCKKDYSCFVKNVALCRKAKAELVMPLIDDIMTGTVYLITYNYEVVGKDKKGCAVSSSYTDARVSLSPDWIESLVKNTLDPAEWIKKIRNFVAMQKKSFRVENKTVCVGKPQNIVTMLDNMKNVKFAKIIGPDGVEHSISEQATTFKCESKAAIGAGVITTYGDDGSETTMTTEASSGSLRCVFKPDVVCESTFAAPSF